MAEYPAYPREAFPETRSAGDTTAPGPKGQPAPYSDCLLGLIHGGQEFFDTLIGLIGQSKSEILLQFYIFNDDHTGLRVIKALQQAAARGVKAYVLVDGFESRSLSEDFLRETRFPGIFFRRFEPLFRSEKFYIGRRLHHKICVFDGVQALTGGINIADRYRGTEGELPWLDYAVYVAGAAAGQLRQVCLRYWNKATDMKLGGLQPGGPVQTELAGRSLQHGSARVRINDRVKGKNEIWKTYFDILNQAKESITIICSYFIPGWIFLRLIRKAISRGVTVRVILAGISDVMLAKHAERYLYRWMLRHGVEIYEYKHSVLHAKVAIRDSRQMTIGSYNLNNISALASIECNLEVRNKPFVSQVEKELLAIALHDSERITPANFKATQNLVKQFWQWTCYQIIKVVLFLATFYFRREH